MNLAEVNIGNQFFTGGTAGSNVFAASNLLGVSSLVSLFIRGAFALAGLILLFYFIFGGIGMISNAGQNDPQKAEAAKKTITSAMIGFVIVFASYWIVKLIGQFINLPIL